MRADALMKWAAGWQLEYYFHEVQLGMSPVLANAGASPSPKGSQRGLGNVYCKRVHSFWGIEVHPLTCKMSQGGGPV